MVPGETVYGEKKIVVEASVKKTPDISIGYTQVLYIYQINSFRKMKPVNFYINQLPLCYSIYCISQCPILYKDKAMINKYIGVLIDIFCIFFKIISPLSIFDL